MDFEQYLKGVANAPLKVILPGQAFVGSNMAAWQQSVKTGLAAQKDYSTWAVYNPINALFKRIF